MIEAIKIFFADNFGSIIWLAIILISMVPVIEARIAIPFGLASEIWQENTLPPLAVGAFALVGGVITSVILLLALRPVLQWLKTKKGIKKLSEKIEKIFSMRAVGVEKSAKEKQLYKCFLLYLFAAIPIPLTGVWTSSAIAAYTNLGFFKSFLAITLGNITAIGIILLICTIFENATLVILIAFFALIALFILIRLIMHFIKKYKNISPDENNIS